MTCFKDNSYFIYEVDKHEQHKKELIKLFKLIPQNKLNSISHTDWNLPRTLKREWADYFYHNVFDDWKKSFHEEIKQNIHLHNAWFQWYEKGDSHNWHTHGETHFTNVYYLNLPNKDIKTSIKIFDDEKNIDVKEGEIITFPAYWKHCSPVNIYDEPKIIISFNIDIKEF